MHGRQVYASVHCICVIWMQEPACSTSCQNDLQSTYGSNLHVALLSKAIVLDFDVSKVSFLQLQTHGNCGCTYTWVETQFGTALLIPTFLS